MLRVGILFLFLLYSSSQVKAWFSFKISNVEQCAPVSLTFWNNSKSDKQSFFSDKPPSSLIILPLGSPPLSIPVLNVTNNSTSVTVTFLPLPAGSSFIASLEDEDGKSTGFVSDIIPVQPSRSNNATCLPPLASQKRVYDFDVSQVTQCAPFIIQYDQTAVLGPPIVKAYVPRGFSARLNATNTTTSPGEAEYEMTLFRGFQTVLSIRDPDGEAFETSNLTAVGGDALSSKDCFMFGNFSSNPGANKTGAKQQLPSSTVAGIGAAVGIVVTCSLLLVVFLVLRTRRRRNRLGVKLPDSPSVPPDPPINQPMVNPPYVAVNYSRPPSTVDQGRSLSIYSFTETMFSSTPRTAPIPTPEVITPPGLSPISVPPLSGHRRRGSVDVPVTPSVVGLWMENSQPVSMVERTSWNAHGVPPGTTGPFFPVSVRGSEVSSTNMPENPFKNPSGVTYRETGQSLRVFQPHHQPKPSVQSSIAGSVYFVPVIGGPSPPLPNSQRDDNKF